MVATRMAEAEGVAELVCRDASNIETTAADIAAANITATIPYPISAFSTGHPLVRSCCGTEDPAPAGKKLVPAAATPERERTCPCG